jgi:hypothetical protein
MSTPKPVLNQIALENPELTTIERILIKREQTREAKRQEVNDMLDAKVKERENKVSPILDFVKETQQHPKYGKLLKVQVAWDFTSIEIYPSDQAYDAIKKKHGGEDPDDLGWEVEKVTLNATQDQLVFELSKTNPCGRKTVQQGTVEFLTKPFQEALADLIEEIIALS